MAADAGRKQHRSRWIWVSVLLGVAAVGLLVWALTVKSDLNSTEDDLDSTSQQLSSSKQELDAANKELDESQQQVEQLESQETTDRRRRVAGALGAAGGLAAVKAVYDDLAEQLGATEDELGATEAELEETQKDLEAATKAADEAAGDAEAAKREASQADNASDKAQAETAQAKAEAEAEKAKSTVVADCVSAYVSAFGGLFEGDSVREQAATVRKQFADITDDCKGVLAGA